MTAAEQSAWAPETFETLKTLHASTGPMLKRRTSKLVSLQPVRSYLRPLYANRQAF